MPGDTKRKIEHSQNFICQQKLTDELLNLSNIGPNDLVVEIGPGKGMITRALLKRAGHVIAVEQDPKFIAELSLLDIQDQFQLVVADFLEWQLPKMEYKVFSNPPFNYTADIVSKLTSSEVPPTDIFLIMQEAAAYRYAGIPYERNSQISILLSVDFTVEIVRKISRHYFQPRPNVSIVFVHFAKRSASKIPKRSRQLFRDFVVYGYNQWAPTVLDAFRNVFSKQQLSIIERNHSLGGLKPSDLTFDQWSELFNIFDKYVSGANRERIHGSENQLREKHVKLSKLHRTRKPMNKWQTSQI